MYVRSLIFSVLYEKRREHFVEDRPGRLVFVKGKVNTSLNHGDIEQTDNTHSTSRGNRTFLCYVGFEVVSQDRRSVIRGMLCSAQPLTNALRLRRVLYSPTARSVSTRSTSTCGGAIKALTKPRLKDHLPCYLTTSTFVMKLL